MATASAEAMAHGGGHGNGHASSSGHENSSGSAHATGRTFRRDLFLNLGGTGREIVTEKGPKRGRAKESMGPNEVQFSDELKKEYTTFLQRHITNLTNLHNSVDPAEKAAYEQIMQTRRLDKKLVHLLADHEHDLPENVSDMQSSEQKIAQFLDRPEGWIITTKLMEEQTAMKLYALGLRAANIAPGERAGLADRYTVKLGIDQGRLNQFYDEQVDPNKWKISGLLGTGAATAIGAAVWGAAGAGGGFGLPVVSYGFYRAMRSMGKEGMKLDLRQCSAAFQAIDSNPAEKAYVEHVMKINTWDFGDNGNNSIRLLRGRVPETTRSVHELQNEVLQGLYARQQFYEALGIPRKQLDALPEQLLYDRMPRTHEQTGLRIDEQIQREFNANGGGYLPNDEQGNIKRFMEARRKVLGRHIDRYVQKELSRKHHEKNPLEHIKKLREGYAESGAFREKRLKQLNEQKDAYASARGTLDAERQALIAYKNRTENASSQHEISRGNAKEAADQIMRTLRNPGHGVFGTEADALDALNAVIDNAGVSIVIDGKTVTSLADRRKALADVEDERFDETPTGGGVESPRQKEDRRATWAATRQRRIDALNKQLDAETKLVQDTIQKLKNAQRAENVALAEEVSSTNADVVKAGEQIQKMEKSYAEITSWDAPPATQIDQAALEGKSIDELMNSINELHTQDNALGWPKAENSNPEHRMTVVRAMTEARARTLHPYAEDPGDNFRYLTLEPRPGAPLGSAGWGLSEHQLLTESAENIQKLIESRKDNPAYAGALVPVDINQIREAQTAAEYRLKAKISAMEQMDTELQRQVQIAETAISAVSFDKEKGLLQVAENMITHKENIADKVYEIVNHPGEFTNDNPLNALSPDDQEEYTEEERKHAGYTQGYFELLNYFFDYKESADPPRGEYFKMIHEVMPPHVLARRLNSSLGLGVPTPSLRAVLPELRRRLQSQAIDEHELRESFKHISEWLGRRALALAT